MEFKFFLLSYEDSQDPRKRGFPYALKHKSEWVTGNCTENYLGTGYTKGYEHIVKDGKVYDIERRYFDLDNKYIVFICPEVNRGMELMKYE